MFCPNCGKQMKENASFCSNCGYKKTGGKSSNIPKMNIPKVDLSKVQAKVIIPVIAVVVVVVLIFTVFNSGSKQGLKQETKNYCGYNNCGKEVYKDGLCQNHYSQLVTADNVNDVFSGKKSVSDAFKDTYDNSFTDDQKQQINEGLNSLKNLFGN